MADHPAGRRLAVISLEPWDDVWRRNQHFASRLAQSTAVSSLLFIEPPNANGPNSRQLDGGITVVTPPLPVPPRFGGLLLTAHWLRRHWLKDVELLWVNNAALGRLTLVAPAVYDVTDDWRASRAGWASRRRLLRAEGILARRARTVVCSEVLQQRWSERYGVNATLVQNGVDVQAITRATGRELRGPGPHFGYVGTLHEERLDVDVVIELARSGGTVHLVGPDHMASATKARLGAEPNISLVGAVPSTDVPEWLQSLDVLLMPHVVSAFTLSLDAIKAHEYLATRKPVVATPTSGFQALAVPGVFVVSRDEFVAAAHKAVGTRRNAVAVADWSTRAEQFAFAAWDLELSG